jgi:hypothetical protein
MIYKFKSSATGDVIMLAAQGDQVLRLIGREPSAKGIIEVADMPAALVALQAAIAKGDAPEPAPNDDDPQAAPAVGLRQRLWLRSAHAAQAVVVWGV